MLRRKTHVLVLLAVVSFAVVAGACEDTPGPAQDPPEGTAKAELDDKADTIIRLPATPRGKYEFLRAPIAEDEMPEIISSLPFSEITLWRFNPPTISDHGMLVGGGTHAITLRSNGEATYLGMDGDPREGRYRGEISMFEYGKLSLLLDRFGATDKENSQLGRGVRATNLAATELSLKTTKEKRIIEYRNSSDIGDFRFWVLETAIEGVASRIEWKLLNKE